MKVAELFAEIGFKIEGKEDLKALESGLQSIANAAREAAIALKDLAAARIPKAITVKQAVPTQSTAQAQTTASWWSQFQARQKLSNSLAMPQPPMLQTQQPAMPNSVLQGFKALGMFGLKLFGIASLAAILKKLVSALTDMVKASMAATFAVDKFTTQTGLSRRELKEWERIAALSDVKAEELQETLKGLQQRSRQIRFTGEGATPFLQMGVNAMASPTDILKQFAQRSKNMDAATAVFFGNQMGISENMVYMLRKNADQIDKMLPRGELADEQHQKIMELNKAWGELTFNLGLLRDKIVSDFAPAVKVVLDLLTAFAKANTTFKPLRDWTVSGGGIIPTVRLARDLMTGGNTTKVENNIQVDVNGSGDPKETAKATAEALRRELSDSYYSRPPPWSVNAAHP